MNLGFLTGAFFALYIPIYALLLWYVVKKFYKYTTAKYSISYLGTFRSKKHRVFNISTFAYGLLTFLFATTLKGSLPAGKFSDYLVPSMEILGISTALIAAFPVDLYKFWHDLSAVGIFVSSITLGWVILGMNLGSGFVSTFLAWEGGALLIVTFLFGYEIVRFAISRKLKRVMWNLEWMWAILLMSNSLSLAAVLLGEII